jgi:hypothetical protein
VPDTSLKAGGVKAVSLTAVCPPCTTLLPCSPRGRRSSPAGSQGQPAAAVCKGAGGSSQAEGRRAAENRCEQPSCGRAGWLPGSVLPDSMLLAVGPRLGPSRHLVQMSAAGTAYPGLLTHQVVRACLLSHAVPPHLLALFPFRRLPPRQRRLRRPSACGRSSNARRRCSSCWKVIACLPAQQSSLPPACLPASHCLRPAQPGEDSPPPLCPTPPPATGALTRQRLHLHCLLLHITSLPPLCCPCRRGAGGGEEAW